MVTDMASNFKPFKPKDYLSYTGERSKVKILTVEHIMSIHTYDLYCFHQSFEESALQFLNVSL